LRIDRYSVTTGSFAQTASVGSFTNAIELEPFARSGAFARMMSITFGEMQTELT